MRVKRPNSSNPNPEVSREMPAELGSGIGKITKNLAFTSYLRAVL